MHTLNQITEVAQELFKSREIEMNVLEAILTDRIDLDQVKPAYFADKDTSTLARTIFKLKDKGIKPDYSTICNQLKIDGVRINGSSLAEMLGEIVGNPFPVKVESNLKLLVEMYKRRESFKSAKEYLTILTESDESLELLNTAFASKIDKITLDDSTTDDALDGVIERLNKDLHSAYDLEERNRYKYGISKLDEFTAGLHPSELTTVAAKSGIGKSAFALQVNPEKKTKYYFHVSKMVDPEQFSSLQVRDVVEYVPMERDLTRERFKCGEAYFVEKSSAKINNFYLNLKGGK